MTASQAKLQRDADVFFAIADPTRRGVLDLLLEGSRNAGDIASAFPYLTQPGVSRHLRVLRDAGLVDVEVNAQQRIYTIKPEGLRELNHWISKYESFWTDKLDALEAHLNARKDRKNKPGNKK